MRREPRPPAAPVRAVPIEKVRDARGQRKIPVPRSKVASTRAFRRVRADRVAGAFGIVFVIVATILIFTWPEPPVKVEPAVAIRWPEETHTGFQDTVALTRAVRDFSQAIEFPEANVTRVTITVKWRDDVGNELGEFDNLSFRLEGPESANVTIAFSDAADNRVDLNVSRSATAAKVPTIREAPVATVEEARVYVGDRSNTNGTGTWRLTIGLAFLGDDFHDNTSRSLGSCPDQVPGQVNPACTPDPGQSVEVLVTYRAYRMELEPPGPA